MFKKYKYMQYVIQVIFKVLSKRIVHQTPKVEKYLGQF